jgi:hypothetical protein
MKGKKFRVLLHAELPDGIFSNQKSLFGSIFEGLTMEDCGIFYGLFVIFCGLFGIFYGYLVYFSRFGMLTKNPDCMM